MPARNEFSITANFDHEIIDIFLITGFVSFIAGDRLLAQGGDARASITTALSEFDSFRLNLDPRKFLLAEFEVKIEVNIPRENQVSVDRAEETHSISIAMPIRELQKPTFVKYTSSRPSKGADGLITSNAFREGGIAKFENGVWSHYLGTMETGQSSFQRKNLIISKPGYTNIPAGVDALFAMNPLKFVFSEDASMVRFQVGNSGFKSWLEYASQTGSSDIMQVSLGQTGNPSLAVLLGGDKTDPEAPKETIKFDLSKGLAPVSYHYQNKTTEPDQVAAWSVEKHSYVDMGGWVPEIIKGSDASGMFSRKYNINVKSLKIVGEETIKESFSQLIGPGWTVRDESIGETFELGDEPSGIIKRAKDIKK